MTHTITENQAGEAVTDERLGRFGHHPDPAIDFEIEVESLIGMAFDAEHGISKPGHPPRSHEEVAERISKALDFRVGGDPTCVAAKAELRKLASSFSPALRAPIQGVGVKGDYDGQALRGAAEYFEQIATLGNPAPLAFANAIRRVLGETQP